MFVLEPLGPEHNDQDYYGGPRERSASTRCPGRKLQCDAGREPRRPAAPCDDFRNRTGFTYTVLDPASRDVIGCVYIYPRPDSDDDARALSWVRAGRAQLDTPLWRAVSEWLASEWPFGSVEYAPRA